MEIFAHFYSRILLHRGENPANPVPVLFGHFGEAVPEGVNDELQTVGDLELRENRTEMVGYGSFTDEESLADLLVLQTFADEGDHFALSVSQRFDLRDFRVD